MNDLRISLDEACKKSLAKIEQPSVIIAHDEAILELKKLETLHKLKIEEDEAKYRRRDRVIGYVIDTAKIFVPVASACFLMIGGWRFEQHGTYGSRSGEKVKTMMSLSQPFK